MFKQKENVKSLITLGNYVQIPLTFFFQKAIVLKMDEATQTDLYPETSEFQGQHEKPELDGNLLEARVKRKLYLILLCFD